MKLATVGDVMKTLVMLREWGAKNGPDLTGEGRTDEDRAENEVRKALKVATAWHPLLNDLTGDELFEAAKLHSRASVWFPVPAEIRAQVPRLKLGSLALEAADPETGRDRWPAIVKAAGSLGRNCQDWPETLARRIGVQDVRRLERAIQDCGGWSQLCNADHDATRARMGKRFASSWDRQARATAAGLLPEGKLLDITGELERRRLEGARG